MPVYKQTSISYTWAPHFFLDMILSVLRVPRISLLIQRCQNLYSTSFYFHACKDSGTILLDDIVTKGNISRANNDNKKSISLCCGDLIPSSSKRSKLLWFVGKKEASSKAKYFSLVGSVNDIERSLAILNVTSCFCRRLRIGLYRLTFEECS